MVDIASILGVEALFQRYPDTIRLLLVDVLPNAKEIRI